MVYESVKTVDNTNILIWTTLSPNTIELVHDNITVAPAKPTLDNEIIESP